MNSRCRDSVLIVAVLNSFWAFTKETTLFDSIVLPFFFFIELSASYCIKLTIVFIGHRLAQS